MENLDNVYVQNFLRNLVVKEFLKIGQHLLKLQSKAKCIVFLRHTVYYSVQRLQNLSINQSVSQPFTELKAAEQYFCAK